MKTYCEECYMVYNLEDLKINGVEHLENNIDRYYVECPNCKARYTTHYENDEIRRLQKALYDLLNTTEITLDLINDASKLWENIIVKHGELVREVRELQLSKTNT